VHINDDGSAGLSRIKYSGKPHDDVRAFSCRDLLSDFKIMSPKLRLEQWENYPRVHENFGTYGLSKAILRIAFEKLLRPVQKDPYVREPLPLRMQKKPVSRVFLELGTDGASADGFVGKGKLR
jgi:hypothetical protein